MLIELQNQLAQITVVDDGSSLGDPKPSNLSLTAFWPLLQAYLHEQGKDLNLAGNRCDSIFHSFLVHIAAKCATGNMATDASFLVRLAYSRLGRLKTLDWPAFWDDPSPGFAGGDKQHFNASLSIKPVRQRSKLNASWSALF